jgi:glycosyltransferase involved in cell wall biosynthesis
MKKTYKKNTKVLLVGPVPPPYGGIPYYVKTLFESGISEVEFLLFNTALPAGVVPLNREGKRSYASLFETGFWVAIKKTLFVLLSIFRIAFTILRDRPHIIHVFTCSYWGYWRNWIYILVGKLLGRKTIFHLLGAIDIFYEEVGETQKKWLRTSLNSADEYLVQSPELRRWVEQYSARPVRSLWNGIYLDQIAPKEESSPQFITPSSKPVGITIGGLGKNKGAAELIQAIEQLKAVDVDLDWVFVGGGDVANYRALVEARGLAENIRFTGVISEAEKWQYLHHADLFCLPSYAEGQPISILEAMAVGLPIISTAVGSITEVVRDGIDGYIIPPVDIDLLAGRIKELVETPEKCREMGQNAQQVAEERHDIHTLFENMTSVYIALIAE